MMKELTLHEVQEVFGAFRFGCDFIKPSTFLAEGMAVGSMWGAGFGAGGAAAATSSAMAAGGVIGAAGGLAAFTGYSIGTGFNRIFGRCDW